MMGELILINELADFENEFGIIFSRYDFGLSMYIDDEKTLEVQLNKKKEMKESIDEYINYLKIGTAIDEEEIKKQEEIKRIIDNLFENIEFIRLNFNEDVDILEFIENNPIVREKKIVLSEYFDIKDYDKVYELLVKYDKYKDNIYVSLENNSEYISLENCLNTIAKVKLQADRIMNLNLSPMEIIMYTYDQVRNRVYKSENSMDSPFKSRDLSSVLNNDEIVCVGYSNIFRALLFYMGINCLNVGLSNKLDNNLGGHQRNVIYVKDDKYDIDGVYYFDVTWDSKRNFETNEFLNRYVYFAKTRKEMSELELNSFIYEECPYYSLDMVDDVKKLFDEEDLVKLDKEYAKSLNYMAYLINGKKLIDRMCLLPFVPNYNKFDREEVLSRLEIIEEKFNKPISAEVFLRLLNNVRKIEYYENPELYPYSINDLYKVYIRSGWCFERHHYNSEEKLLMLLFDEDELNMKNRNHKMDDFVTFIGEENLGRNIKEVHLTKVLQKISKKEKR